MKNARSLALKRESLTELAAADLAAVAGAAVKTTPVNECLGISFEFTCLDCITRRDCE
jgi:hypothetical protein